MASQHQHFPDFTIALSPCYVILYHSIARQDVHVLQVQTSQLFSNAAVVTGSLPKCSKIFGSPHLLILYAQQYVLEHFVKVLVTCACQSLPKVLSAAARTLFGRHLDRSPDFEFSNTLPRPRFLLAILGTTGVDPRCGSMNRPIATTAPAQRRARVCRENITLTRAREGCYRDKLTATLDG